MKKVFAKAIDCLQYLKCVIFYFSALVAGLFMKHTAFYKDLWLIAERQTEARDNGYHFFKYMREQHSDINCAFVIAKSSPDYERVAKLGPVVEPGGVRHYIAFACAKANISTHLMGCAPDTYRFAILDKVFNLVRGKKVSLRHGITSNTLTGLFYPKSRFDILTCSAISEYNDMVKNYGHPNGVVQRLGLCRFDNLLSEHTVKRQILIMPTWRSTLYDLSDEDFKKSDYYQNFNSLISDPRLHKLLEDYDYEAVLYLHTVLQPFTGLFKSSPRVKVDSVSNSDVQKLLMESALLVTDYSSVFFDFSYMDKPVAFLQFDEEEFFSKHYKRGYFSYKNDGFGPVCDNPDEIIDFIASELRDNMQITQIYKDRMDAFFGERRSGNCQRTYEAICRLFDKKAGTK